MKKETRKGIMTTRRLKASTMAVVLTVSMVLTNFSIPALAVEADPGQAREYEGDIATGSDADHTHTRDGYGQSMRRLLRTGIIWPGNIGEEVLIEDETYLYGGDYSAESLDLGTATPADATAYQAGSGYLLWEPVDEGGTLTLNNATMESEGDGILTPNSTRIQLVGKNKIQSTGPAIKSGAGASLIIRGEGTLTLKVSDTGNIARAIDVDGNLTIQNATLRIEGAGGINASSNLTIEESVVTGTLKNAASVFRAEEVVIQDSQIKVSQIIGQTFSNIHLGILGTNSVSISGSRVKIHQTITDEVGELTILLGIAAMTGNVTISNSNIDTEGTNNTTVNCASAGIYTQSQDIIISEESTVYATVTNGTKISAISAIGNIKINNSRITAKANSTADGATVNPIIGSSITLTETRLRQGVFGEEEGRQNITHKSGTAIIFTDVEVESSSSESSVPVPTTTISTTATENGGSIKTIQTIFKDSSGKTTTVTTRTIKDAAGNVTENTTTVETDNVQTKTEAGRTDITVKPDAVAINTAVGAAGASATSPLDVTISIPQETMVSQLHQADVNTVHVNVVLPDSVRSNTAVQAVGVTINRETIEAAKQTGKRVEIIIQGEAGVDKAVVAVWSLSGQDIRNAVGQSTDLTLGVYTTPVKSLATAIGQENGLALTIAAAGTLLSPAKLTIPAINQTGITAGTTVTLHKLNETTGVLSPVAGASYMVDANGNVTIDIPAGTRTGEKESYVLLPAS